MNTSPGHFSCDKFYRKDTIYGQISELGFAAGFAHVSSFSLNYVYNMK